MHETLRDFDAVDAFVDQGAVIPQNLKTLENSLHIPEVSAMMREWSMPRADALALSLSKGAPAGIRGRGRACGDSAKRKGG
jgi:hypothetical protein